MGDHGDQVATRWSPTKIRASTGKEAPLYIYGDLTNHLTTTTHRDPRTSPLHTSSPIGIPPAGRFGRPSPVFRASTGKQGWSQGRSRVGQVGHEPAFEAPKQRKTRFWPSSPPVSGAGATCRSVFRDGPGAAGRSVPQLRPRRFWVPRPLRRRTSPGRRRRPRSIRRRSHRGRRGRFAGLRSRLRRVLRGSFSGVSGGPCRSRSRSICRSAGGAAWRIPGPWPCPLQGRCRGARRAQHRPHPSRK